MRRFYVWMIVLVLVLGALSAHYAGIEGALVWYLGCVFGAWIGSRKVRDRAPFERKWFMFDETPEEITRYNWGKLKETRDIWEAPPGWLRLSDLLENETPEEFARRANREYVDLAFKDVPPKGSDLSNIAPSELYTQSKPRINMDRNWAKLNTEEPPNVRGNANEDRSGRRHAPTVRGTGSGTVDKG